MNNVNSALRSVFNDLVEKRLWPVAAALGIALIAIPVLLSKPAATEPAAGPTPPVTPATGSGGSLSAFQPVVNTEGKKSSEIRKNLRGFQSKDPFKVHGLGGGGDSSDSGTVTVEGTGTASAGGGGGDTGSGSLVTPDSTSGSGDQGTSGSGDQGTSGSGSAGLTYYHYTVDVRFGKSDNLDKKRLENFRALPSSENPVIVFMGVKDDGETAVFLVSSASSTTGEGDCEPDDTCTFLYMKAGDQQSFEAVDGNDQVVTYVLKLLDVNVEQTTGPDQASSSKSERRAARRAARAQRSSFKRRIQAVGF
jgi:hypothetical protein